MKQLSDLRQLKFGRNTHKARSLGRTGSPCAMASGASLCREDSPAFGNQWADRPGRQSLSPGGFHLRHEWSLGVVLGLLILERKLDSDIVVAQIVQVALEPQKNYSN